MTTPTLEFWVPGKPATGGSKKRKWVNGKERIVDDCDRNKPWREKVALFARQAHKSRPFLRGAIRVHVVFALRRPKHHYGKDGQLLGSAPVHHLQKPDSTKLWRAAEDAITNIAWGDDAQVVLQTVAKTWADTPDKEGARVKIWALETAA